MYIFLASYYFFKFIQMKFLYASFMSDFCLHIILENEIEIV